MRPVAFQTCRTPGIAVADITIPKQHYLVLRRSANCFVPKIVSASAAIGNGFTNTDLYRAGQSTGQKSFSLHVVGTAMALKAVTHEKAERFVFAYSGLPEDTLREHGVVTVFDIVAAFLAVPLLPEKMDERGLTVEALVRKSGVSQAAIEHAVQEGRVTGGIAAALYKALYEGEASAPPLAEFATSDPTESVGKKAVKGAPFTLDDLLLPLPKSTPNPWR